MKTIGLLTSGGDAPGMNAAIRAVVRTALYWGYRVLGIKRGFNGLITGDVEELQIRSVSGIIHRGGTILHTARSPEFMTQEGQKAAAQICREFGMDAVVVIGGDGSFRGALDLSKQGVACIGVPGTIDNDVGCSEYTIGFDTAMNTAVEMVDKLRDTTQSHERCSVVEVMGRRSGQIAVNAGIAAGAVATLIPERPYDFERDVLDRMVRTKSTGKTHFIILVAEGVAKAEEIAKEVQARTGIEARSAVLGHVQRGGAPTVRDRVMASRMGFRAVELLKEGKKNRIVAWKDGDIADFGFEEAFAMKNELSPDLMRVADVISL